MENDGGPGGQGLSVSGYGGVGNADLHIVPGQIFDDVKGCLKIGLVLRVQGESDNTPGRTARFLPPCMGRAENLCFGTGLVMRVHEPGTDLGIGILILYAAGVDFRQIRKVALLVGGHVIS